MKEFYHPYNFIPVIDKASSKIDYDDIKEGKITTAVRHDMSQQGTYVRHDMWQQGTYSGRIIARLFLNTPTVVGGQHKKENDEQATQVLPYYRNEKIAIPANSLRGMIGSIAETLSQSALRVLEKKRYSVRKPVEKGLSAIGMLRKNDNSESGLDLLPLTVPIHLTSLWSEIFDSNMLTKYCVVAPIYGYKHNVQTNRVEKTKGTFLDNHPELESFHENKVKFYYVCPQKHLTQQLKHTKGLLLGQEIDQKDILTTAEYNLLTIHEQKHYVRGFLRILGIDGRESEMPPTKKREFFIPFPPRDSSIPVPIRLPIPKTTIDTFITLAKERHEESEGKLPFLPKGYTNWQPESGQLVFFDIQKNNNGQIEVSEISYSSIWRKLIEGDSHQFFSQISKETLPWNPERDSLTPAECLFGVIESEKKEGQKQARALASRVRFHDGQAIKTVEVELESEVTLKILSSPKPPSPAMYFHPKNKSQGTYIKKTDLNSKEHIPNGRKYYLHHPEENIKNCYWETKHPTEELKQKMSCQPMKAGQAFYFHIDFDNLTTEELHLLIRSLHPSDTFRHRLGLGKSLGLGSVTIDIEGIFFIDRLKRYSLAGFTNPNRYHQALRGTCQTEDWNDLYPVEWQAIQQATENLTDTEFYTKTPNLIDNETLQLLQTIGNPANIKPNIPLKPPLTCEQQDTEEETFKWFGENDDDPKNENGGKALPAVEIGRPLPVLHCIHQSQKKSKKG